MNLSNYLFLVLVLMITSDTTLATTETTTEDEFGSGEPDTTPDTTLSSTEPTTENDFGTSPTTDITSDTTFATTEPTTENEFGGTPTKYTFSPVYNGTTEMTTLPEMKSNVTGTPAMHNRFGTGDDTETTIPSSTDIPYTERSTDINLEDISKHILTNAKDKTLTSSTRILEATSTSKPAESLGKDTLVRKEVSKGEAAGILIASLIVAVAFICITKIVYNRYKARAYDVRQHGIEMGNNP